MMLVSVGMPITAQPVFPTFTEGEEPKFVPEGGRVGGEEKGGKGG